MLLIDVGNTFIKWGTPQKDQSLSTGRFLWKEFGIARHNEINFLPNLWQELHLVSPISRIIVSNVAGETIRTHLMQYFETLTPQPTVHWFASQKSCGGITNTYLKANSLGCDRFASLIGAKAICPNTPLIVVTAGTATTIDALSPDGTFLGGMILPGLKLMAQSLSQNTAQLPPITSFEGTTMFARQTNDAILSGCLHAQVGAITHAVNQLSCQFEHVQCLLSGGAAQYIGPSLPIDHRIIDNLVLIGLYSCAG